MVVSPRNGKSQDETLFELPTMLYTHANQLKVLGMVKLMMQ